VTKEEIPYMHDLSIFIGRKYYDCPSVTDSGKELSLDEILGDPQMMCFGKLPQSVTDEYLLQHTSLHERYPTVLDPLKRSLHLSLLKYNKNRDAASPSAVTATRNLLMPRVHPMLLTKLDSHEEELDHFKESLSKFKPKQSVLEIGLIRAMDQSRLSKFQHVLSLQKEKYMEKLERKAYAKDLKRQFEEEQKVQEDQVIKMKSYERENDRKLEDGASQAARPKISKKRRMKIEKIRQDESLTEQEKLTMIRQIH